MAKKKILIFGLSSLIGGVETYIINLVQKINKEKFEIDFLVQEPIEGINKEKIKGCYKNIYLVENMKRHPYGAFKTLKKIYKENNYDAIYLNISTASSVLYALPSKIYSKYTKIIVHSHNGNDKNKLQHCIFRFILNKITDKYVACSMLAAEWMFGKKIIKSKKITIINNAIDADKFIFNESIRNKIRKELKIENDFVIGHVGRFNKQKNHVGLLKIFYELAKEENDVKLLLIGTGELQEDIKKHVQKLNLSDKVLFLGVMDNVNEYYNAMDIFLLPSLFEGLPIVGIEAQANGLKCIFSDSITKEVDITKNACFLPINESRLWIDKILEYKKMNYKRKNMKKIIVDKNYDINIEIKKIEGIYKKEE